MPNPIEPSLLLAVGGPSVSDELAAEAARAGGLDPYGTRIALRHRGVVLLARGDSGRLLPAAQTLERAGVRAAVFTGADVRSIPRVQVAGGVAAEGKDVGLRVHGRPFGPPAGEALLLVFGDLSRQSAVQTVRRVDGSLRQRILRAAYPVVDVVWRQGRVRIAARQMSWRELPESSYSGPANLAHLIDLLVASSGGAVSDVGFDGQDTGLDPPAMADEPLEGADRERVNLFERYAAAATIAWLQDLYPRAPAGSMAADAQAPELIAPPAAFVSPVPWVRREKASRLRLGLVPWIIFGPLLAIRLFPNARLAAAALAVCGAASLGVAVAGLRLRERVRAMPQSRVRSLAMGPVELSGRVVPCARLTAPYSRVLCAWYRFELQEQSRDSESGDSYRTIYSASSGDLPFRLDDGTGLVLVQPGGAQVDVDPGSFPQGPGERVREWVLAEGETVFVFGTAQRRSPFEEEKRLLQERIRALKHDPLALARYGLAPGGEGNLDAWDQARADVGRRVEEELSARESEADNVFVGSAPGVPFLIAAGSRGAQARRLGWQFAAGAALGTLYLIAAVVIAVVSWGL